MSRKGFYWPAVAALTAFFTIAMMSIAVADDFSVDNDIQTNGNQNTVNLSAALGGTVTASAQIVVDWQGTKHLMPSTPVTFSVNPTQTTLPSGYTVSSVTSTVPSNWDDTTDSFVAGSASIAFTAPSTAGSYSYAVKWDNSVETCAPFTGGGDCLTGGDAFTINLTVSGSSNTPPTVDAGGPYTGDEGSAISLDGTVTDPNSGDTVTTAWTYAIDSADSGTTCAFASASAVDTTISCTDDGTFTLTLTANDGHNPDVKDAASLTLTNADPVISATSFASSTASCGADNVSLSVAFTDPGSNDTHKADIDWGDGTSSTVDPYTTGTPIPHTYLTAGSHTASVTITDDDGGYDTDSATVWVNYNMTGILQPVNDTGHGALPSIFKHGSTVPVKVEVKDCDGSHPSNLTLKVMWSVNLTSTPPGEGEAASTSAADSGNTMRFSDPIYIFNLASKSVTSDSSSGVKLFVSLMNGTKVMQSTSAQIGFKK